MAVMRLAKKIEDERDDKVRTLGCPVCGVAPGARCQFPPRPDGGAVWAHTSHTGRYRLAAGTGLVPALPGMWGLREPSWMS
jgi:hypothetical protein